MPQGNAHELPPGLWYQEPTTSSLPKLFMKSTARLAGLGVCILLFWEYRSLSWKYTYKNFIGKTMSLGKISVLDHEPLSVEEIDRLRAQQKEKKIYL